jgi:cytochrome c oxidase subunit IV
MNKPHDPHQPEHHGGTGHDHDAGEQDVHDSQTHIVPPSIYIIVGTILLILTGTTVWASYLELGLWNPVVALFIACVKATIVVLFFMHVKYSSKLTKLTVFSGLFLFAVLISLTLADYTTRAWGRW